VETKKEHLGVGVLPPIASIWFVCAMKVLYLRGWQVALLFASAAALLVWTLSSAPENKLLTDKDCYEAFQRMFARRLAHDPPQFSLSPEEESNFKACEPTDH
jgi:hypothetical protein